MTAEEKQAEKEKRVAFLKEYLVLCEKHGYMIDACGCCDSPWIGTIAEFTNRFKDRVDPFNYLEKGIEVNL